MPALFAENFIPVAINYCFIHLLFVCLFFETVIIPIIIFALLLFLLAVMIFIATFTRSRWEYMYPWIFGLVKISSFKPVWRPLSSLVPFYSMAPSINIDGVRHIIFVLIIKLFLYWFPFLVIDRFLVTFYKPMLYIFSWNTSFILSSISVRSCVRRSFVRFIFLFICLTNKSVLQFHCWFVYESFSLYRKKLFKVDEEVIIISKILIQQSETKYIHL